MAFNYRVEKLKFDRKWVKLCKEYEDAGMLPADIDTMYEFDCAWFRSRRRFENHTQELPEEQIDEEDENYSSLIKKFASMRTVKHSGQKTASNYSNQCQRKRNRQAESGSLCPCQQ